MDETSLRAQLELAVSDEPPLGQLVGNSLRAGRRLRSRRRAIGTAALSAVAVVLVSVVSVGAAGAFHQVSRPRPAAAPASGTAYVDTGSSVFPISLATSAVGAPISVPEGVMGPFPITGVTSPDGRTVYEIGESGDTGVTVTPIDTTTNTAGPTITVNGAYAPEDFVFAPNGKTAYLSTDWGLFRINTVTNTVSKAPECMSFYGQERWRNSNCWPMAFTPNGKTLYVCTDTTPRNGGRIVTAIPTASDTPPTRIRLPLAGDEPGFPYFIAITPNGKTAYVLDEVAGAKPGLTTVVPINVATNTPLTPIKISAPGTSEGLMIAPDGRTAYVLSGRAVTAINTATNQAEATINLPTSRANPYFMVMAPNGKRLYVMSTHGVVPIRTASNTLLPTIKVPDLYAFDPIAITPDSRTIYVGAEITKGFRKFHQLRIPVVVARGVIPISTATDTAGHFINLGGIPFSITFAP
jgi:YVTN family beta-propeller protein